MPWVYDLASRKWLGPKRWGGPGTSKYSARGKRFRMRVARGRIRAIKVIRDQRYRRRVSAAKQQFMYRYNQMPSLFRQNVRNYLTGREVKW